MYNPKLFAESDKAILDSLIRNHPFANWTTWTGESLVVNHLPFVLHPDDGLHGTLVGHVARANSVWRQVVDGQPSVVVFQGPHSYITPNWYPGKLEHGKVVPTWNYAVVHVRGTARVIDDTDWLLQHVSELSNSQEVARELPWQVSDAPADFMHTMLKGIVGIEISISTIEGKWKISQNRSEQDRAGVVAGLMANGDSTSATMAAMIGDKRKS